MKFLCMGDLQLRVTIPVNRIDNFFETQDRKIDWILNTAKEEKCEYILQPGDFFDSWKIPHFLERYIIEKLKKNKIKMIAVYGQHDLRYHSSDRKNTPLAVLEAAKVVSVLAEDNKEPFIVIPGSISIYGCSWKEQIPKINKKILGIHILLMHKMIIDKVEGWEKNFMGVQELFDTTEFDLMVTGDNHKGFAYSDGERHLINCGSLLRSDIDQKEHEPYVYIYDSTTRKMKGIPIPIEPFKAVMNISKAEEEKEEDERLGVYIKSLKKDVKLTGLNFKDNLFHYIKENKIVGGVKNILNELMEKHGHTL